MYKKTWTTQSDNKMRKPRKSKQLRGNSSMAVARRALVLAKKANHKEIKRLENVESSSVTNATDNGVILGITSNISQGTTDSQRVGDNIFLRDIEIKGHANFNTNAASSVEAMVLRIICYYDKSNKINIPGPGVGGYLSVVGTSTIVDSLKYWDSRFETKLIFDKRLTLGRASESQLFSFKCKVGLPTQYNAAGTTETRGALKFLVCSDQDPALQLPEWQFYYRLTYSDS